MNLYDLDLPIRVTQALWRNFGIRTVEELQKLSPEKILQGRNLGPRSIELINNALAEAGVRHNNNKPTNHRCQYENCFEEARYQLYRTYKDGRKKWIHVCKKHEKIIGFQNLKMLGGKI